MEDDIAATILAEKSTSPIRTLTNAHLSGFAPMLDREPVQAYAKLEGDSFSYYIRTLQVTLGRKAQNSENADIFLGTAKSISRHHAKVHYHFLNQRFELVILGKNGAFINDQFFERGTTVPLAHRTKVQIGEVAFYFLLPKTDPTDNVVSAFTSLKNTSSIKEVGIVTSPIRMPQSLPFGDSNKPNYTKIKPPYSYASLIAQAINSTPVKKMTLNGIYNYITSHYPYYQLTQNGWQNSIRHNLSLNKAFVKIPRADGEPGKGAFWTIDQKYEGEFSNGVYKRNRRSSKTSRENSASPFGSPVNARRKSITFNSLEGGTLQSTVSQKFSGTNPPVLPPPVNPSSLPRDPTLSELKELEDRGLKTSLADDKATLSLSCHFYELDTQKIRTKSPTPSAGGLGPPTPTRTLETLINPFTTSHQLLKPRETHYSHDEKQIS